MGLIAVGDKFGRLIIIFEIERNIHNRRQFFCECECGTKKTVTDANLKGSTRSCGCLKAELIKSRLSKTEDSKIKVRQQWESSCRRWLNPENRKLAKDRVRKYRAKHRDKINKVHRDKMSGGIDVQYKLRWNIRNRFKQALLKSYKSGLAIKYLGCSIVELKNYLESKFMLGMTWENYGIKGWHIDHIKPLSSFDLSDENNAAIACHYSNLQPLWAFHNLSKGNKV